MGSYEILKDIEGENQVSNYLKQRALIKYVEKTLSNPHSLDRVLRLTNLFLNVAYDRLVRNPNITHKNLFKPITSNDVKDYDISMLSDKQKKKWNVAYKKRKTKTQK